MYWPLGMFAIFSGHEASRLTMMIEPCQLLVDVRADGIRRVPCHRLEPSFLPLLLGVLESQS